MSVHRQVLESWTEVTTSYLGFEARLVLEKRIICKPVVKNHDLYMRYYCAVLDDSMVTLTHARTARTHTHAHPHSCNICYHLLMAHMWLVFRSEQIILSAVRSTLQRAFSECEMNEIAPGMTEDLCYRIKNLSNLELKLLSHCRTRLKVINSLG